MKYCAALSIMAIMMSMVGCAATEQPRDVYVPGQRTIVYQPVPVVEKVEKVVVEQSKPTPKVYRPTDSSTPSPSQVSADVTPDPVVADDSTPTKHIVKKKHKSTSAKKPHAKSKHKSKHKSKGKHKNKHKKKHKGHAMNWVDGYLAMA